MISYFKEAKKQNGSTGTTLLELIESRLDCIIYRLGFAPTIPSARQIVNHGHICVNDQVVTIPSFLCKVGDSIKVKEKNTSQTLLLNNFKVQQQKREMIQTRMKRIKLTRSRFHSLLPKHLEINTETLIGKFVAPIKRKDILIKINELKVIEYYSR